MISTVNMSVLRNSFLFQEADDLALQQVSAQCEPMELFAGETLFEQDSDPDAMYFLEEGQIHVVRHYPDGYEVIIATEVPYYVIGELSLLANQPRTGSVVAVGDCVLIRLSRSAIFDLFEKHPEVAVRAMSHLGNRLYALNLRVRENAIGNVGARVASLLLMLRPNTEGNLENLSMTRLARATAMDADVVEQMLKQWADQDMITFANGNLKIQNREALRHIAG